MANRIEDRHMMAYFKWLKLAFPIAYECTFHAPNEGKRNYIYGSKLGIKPGVPDIIMLYPIKVFHGLCIELKRPVSLGKSKGILTYSQNKMIMDLIGNGYSCSVCYGWEEAKIFTENYLR